MTRRPPRAGIIGASGVGAEHAQALQRLGVPIAGVAGSSLASAQRAAAQLAVPHAFPDAIALIQSPEVDVVHVCVPDQLHEPIASAALRAGKAVVCEKPLADDTDAAERLRDLAIETGAATTVAYGYRYSRLLPELARVVRDDLGDVIAVRASYLQRWRLASDARGWRADTANGTATSLADVGVHLIDLIEQATGDRFHDLTHRPVRRPGATVDVGAAAIGTLECGAAISLAVSQASAAHTNALAIEIDGTRASARWALSDVEELAVVATPSDRRDTSGNDAGESRSGRFWREPADALERWEVLLGLYYARLGAPMRLTPARALSLPTISDAARHVRLLGSPVTTPERTSLP